MKKDTVKRSVHFGLTVAPQKRGLKLTRDNYVPLSRNRSLGKNLLYIKAIQTGDQEKIDHYASRYDDEEGLVYSEKYYEDLKKRALENYDLNMKFYQNLNHEKFEKEIARFITKTKFVYVEDLTEYKGVEGYYAMVLDEYCQVYIGYTSKGIQERVRQHWSDGKLKVDRLIWGSKETSRLSIDSFRALDTTRILVFPAHDGAKREEKFIAMFSDEFITNRTAGGKMELGLLGAYAKRKKRDL